LSIQAWTGGKSHGLIDHNRFVMSPIPDSSKRLALETAELKDDISNLNKKLNYLETTYKNSREHIDKILSNTRP